MPGRGLKGGVGGHWRTQEALRSVCSVWMMSYLCSTMRWSYTKGAINNWGFEAWAPHPSVHVIMVWIEVV